MVEGVSVASVVVDGVCVAGVVLEVLGLLSSRPKTLVPMSIAARMITRTAAPMMIKRVFLLFLGGAGGAGYACGACGA